MKKSLVAVIAALGACCMAVQGAEAKTLEDILKEKGVITEAEYKEATKVKPIDYKLGKGFTFTSTDEKFQLSLGGRLQARYTFTDNDQAASSTSKDISKWQIQRMKIWLRGYAYTKDLTYLLQVDMVNSNKNTFIDHAYFNYKLIDEAQLLVGQTKVPFGRQWLASSGSLQFVDRSILSNNFRPGYNIGTMLHGKIAKGLVNYNVAGYGSKGQGVPNAGNDMSFAARVTVDPFGNMSYDEPDLDTSTKPRLSVGSNYYYDRVTSNASATTSGIAEDNNLNNIGLLKQLTVANGFQKSEKVDVNLYGADVAFKWMGAFATAEYLLGQVEGDTSGALVRSHGFLVQAGYCILPKKMEAAMRYAFVDPNRDKGNDLQSEIGGAVSYYFNDHNLKVQADVRNLHTQQTGGKSPIDAMEYRLQAQVIF